MPTGQPRIQPARQSRNRRGWKIEGAEWRGEVAQPAQTNRHSEIPFPPSSPLVLPFVPSRSSPVGRLFVIRHPQRDALQQKLAEAGIGTPIHYPVPPHLCCAYSDLRPPTSASLSLPIAEALAGSVLSWPIVPHLSEAQARYVAQTLGSALASIETT
jgi:dTDP-4-amino-4,6-dideoxygalactose transaminase